VRDGYRSSKIIPTATSAAVLPATERPPSRPIEEVIPPTQPPSPKKNRECERLLVDGCRRSHSGCNSNGGYDVRARRMISRLRSHADAYWMEQLEVTNAMYQLCAAGGIAPPQNFRFPARADYYNDPNSRISCGILAGARQKHSEWAGRGCTPKRNGSAPGRAAPCDVSWGEDKPDYRFRPTQFIVRTLRAWELIRWSKPVRFLDMAGNVAEGRTIFYNPAYYSIPRR